MSPFDLSGRTALVTGSARGLGLAIAGALAEAGARVILNGRDAARIEAAAGTLTARGARVSCAVFDVADAVARDRALAALDASGDAIDILVNNVGLRRRGPMADCPPEAFAALLDADLTAPYALIRALAPKMIARGFGRIVNVCSIAGPRARANDAAYTAAKGGLAALTRACAAELGPRGVTCNGIAPGFFATEANAGMLGDEAVGRLVRERIPLGRWGEPSEIGGAAVFLASAAASYVNGHVLTVDGGLSSSF